MATKKPKKPVVDINALSKEELAKIGKAALQQHEREHQALQRATKKNEKKGKK